jgi:hypothetical protein
MCLLYRIVVEIAAGCVVTMPGGAALARLLSAVGSRRLCSRVGSRTIVALPVFIVTDVFDRFFVSVFRPRVGLDSGPP